MIKDISKKSQRPFFNVSGAVFFVKIINFGFQFPMITIIQSLNMLTIKNFKLTE